MGQIQYLQDQDGDLQGQDSSRQLLGGCSEAPTSPCDEYMLVNLALFPPN